MTLGDVAWQRLTKGFSYVRIFLLQASQGVARIRARLEEVVVRVPIEDGKTIAAIYREAEILDRADESTGVLLTARIPAPLLGRLRSRKGVQVDPVAAS